MRASVPAVRDIAVRGAFRQSELCARGFTLDNVPAPAILAVESMDLPRWQRLASQPESQDISWYGFANGQL
jgi:hypothetical protein